VKTRIGRDRSDRPSDSGYLGPPVAIDGDAGAGSAPVPDWISEAVCKGRTSLFFGIAGERPERRVRREAAARKLCGECPVRVPCRILARINRENGFWGGESEEERAAAGFAPRSIARRSVQAASAQHVSITPSHARAAAS
jgi:WhiB family transcriptional regulator, redox-sensing transcriptional regulator